MMQTVLVQSLLIPVLILAVIPDPTVAMAADAVTVGEQISLERAEEILRAEREWFIGETIVPEGGSATGSRLVPYFSNLAFEGLAIEPGYLPLVGKWLTWYLDHANDVDFWGVPGTVYDYSVADDGTLRQLIDYDSADAYAATFFTLAWHYIENGGDPGILLGRREDVLKVASAIDAVMDKDHLTWAKIDYKVKYLMDNVEVWRGLEDLASLQLVVFDDVESTSHYREMADLVKKAIYKKLWRDSSWLPYPGKQPDWRVWYPDATAQLWPIWSGLMDDNPSKRDLIWTKFNLAFPDWPELGFPGPFPWGVLAYTAAVMGDYARLEQYIVTIEKEYTPRRWPWHNAESGWYQRALSSYIDYLRIPASTR